MVVEPTLRMGVDGTGGGGGSAALAGGALATSTGALATPSGSAEGRGAAGGASASRGSTGGPNENAGAGGRCERRAPPSSGGADGRVDGGPLLVGGADSTVGGICAGMPCGGVGDTAFGGDAALRRFPQS